jgi:aryl-alcohol dehydrogenase-like predicted oxidoreductase
MTDSTFQMKTTLGRTGLSVSRIGLAGGYKAPAKAVERAFHDYGINFFYWETRKQGMREALRPLLQTERDKLVVAIQSYDHFGLWLNRSVESALRNLGIEQVEILFLGWFNRRTPQRLLDMALRLQEQGKVRFLGITGHNRLFHGKLSRDPDSPFDLQMIRYNAAHRGAESEIFDGLPHQPPGIVTYTATRWGQLLKQKRMPPGETPLTAAECYRFVLTHPAVDICLAGPRSEEEMDQGLQALNQGPLSPDEMDRIHRIGDHLHG